VAGIPHTQADITDFEKVRAASRGMDMVLHLAAETQDYDDWDKVMRNTMGGTLNMYRAAQEAGVKRVVFMSTGSTMCGY
jgi:nucleoside-diphosphate-sugar epimerase